MVAVDFPDVCETLRYDRLTYQMGLASRDSDVPYRLVQEKSNVNEEIEKTIQRTREIESEILKLSEIEDGHIMRECELSKIITIRGFELEASIQVAGNEKEALENEKQSVTKKMTALENSTEELIEEILLEIHKSNSALDAEIHNGRSEYMGVIGDINDLRILLGSISSFEDS
ncbi:hypothetical protein C4D60_Mb06t08650 [Musa balbisiana]|uniref:Uncharacterized protein n=1 Tax=Musa balbisiana TaxID=52838 RepID=A0A4S8IMC2_MUSBA|nr:hypothetical protein C4D60_Mb06t08650 [Musa balbisiana]